jgi:hypothetical protein
MRFAAKSLDVRGAVHSSFGWMTLSFNYLGAVSPDASSPVDDLECIEIVQPNANVKSSDSAQTKAYTGKVVKGVLYDGVYLAPSYYVDAVYNTPTTPDRPHTDTLQIEGVGIEAPGVKINDSVFFGSNNTALIIGGVANIAFDHSLIVGAGKQTLRYPYLAGGAGYPGAINGEGSKGAIQGSGGGNIDSKDSIFIGSLAPQWDEVSNTKVSIQNKVAANGSFTYDSSLMSWDVDDLNAASPVPTTSYLAGIWNDFAAPTNPTTPTVDTTAPTVSITSPATGTTVGNSVTLTASANDNVAVTKVSFWSGTTKLGDAVKQANGSWSSTVDTTAYPAGNYPVTAKAEDAAGNTKTSTAITLAISHTTVPTPTPTPVVDTTAPNVSVTSPTTGTTVNDSVTLTASATDNVGVTDVSFWSGTTKLADAVKQTNGSWRAIIDIADYSEGDYPVTAKAEDAAGNTKTSTAITLTISHVVIDTTAPNVSITSPTTGATVGNSVTLTATATDNVAVTGVSFWSGTTKLGDAVKQTNGTWRLVASTTAYPNGTYPITAKAEDAAGNTKTSTAINVKIS